MVRRQQNIRRMRSRTSSIRRIRNLRTRKNRQTVITVSNRRPRLQQRNPKPLNLGAGGISSTFRIVESLSLTGLTQGNMTSQINQTFGGSIDLSFTDILNYNSQLSKHYKQIRITRVTGTFQPTAGANNRSSVGFAIVPRTYAPTPSPALTNYQRWLSEGVFVVKKAHLPTVSAWVPTEPDDWNFRGITKTDDLTDVVIDGQDVVCTALIAGLGLYSDFLASKIATTSATTDGELLLGTITWDVSVQLRGRQTASISTTSRVLKHTILNNKENLSPDQTILSNVESASLAP